jgi:DNA-binding PadR family transcriptional regulator
MTGAADRGADDITVEGARILEALAGDALTGAVIQKRIREARTAVGDPTSTDEEHLYPALHSLEASRILQAKWVPNADGTSHRVYRRRGRSSERRAG